jgi:hypothetical protein
VVTIWREGEAERRGRDTGAERGGAGHRALRAPTCRATARRGDMDGAVVLPLRRRPLTLVRGPSAPSCRGGIGLLAARLRTAGPSGAPSGNLPRNPGRRSRPGRQHGRWGLHGGPRWGEPGPGPLPLPSARAYRVPAARRLMDRRLCPRPTPSPRPSSRPPSAPGPSNLGRSLVTATTSLIQCDSARTTGDRQPWAPRDPRPGARRPIAAPR